MWMWAVASNRRMWAVPTSMHPPCCVPPGPKRTALINQEHLRSTHVSLGAVLMAEAVHKAGKMSTLPDLDPNAKKGGIPPVDAGFPGPPGETAGNAERRSVWGLRGGGSGAGGGKPRPQAQIQASFAMTR